MPKTISADTKRRRAMRFKELRLKWNDIPAAVRELANEENLSEGGMRQYLQREGLIGKQTVGRKGETEEDRNFHTIQQKNLCLRTTGALSSK